MRTSIRGAAALPLVLLLAACCGKPPALDCVEFPAGTPEAKYCNDHRDAVAVYFREPDAVPDRIVRFRAFAAFFPSIEGLGDVAAIDAAIRASTAIPGFLPIYDRKHRQAETAGLAAADLKRTLLLSGFRHAREAFRQEHHLDGR